MKTGIPECWKLQAAKHGAGARDHVSPAAKPCRCLGLEAAHVTCALPLPASNQLIGRWVKITMDASKISVGGCGPFGPFDPPPPHTYIALPFGGRGQLYDLCFSKDLGMNVHQSSCSSALEVTAFIHAGHLRVAVA